MHEMTRGNEYQGNLSIGQRVYCGLYGGKYGVVADIIGQQSPETVKELCGGAVVTGGSASVVVYFDDHVSKVPECIIRGVQWRIGSVTELASHEEIKQRETNWKKAMQARKEAEAAKNARQAAEMAALPAKYPQLIPCKEHSGGKQAAANIRIMLKQQFPGVKFSVRSDYDSVRIEWTDGPITEQVNSVVNIFELGNFNGMTDSYDYDHDHVFPRVFGGVKYLFCNRAYTDASIAAAIERVYADYAGNLAGIDKVTVDDYRHGRAYILVPHLGNDTVQCLIMRELQKLPM